MIRIKGLLTILLVISVATNIALVWELSRPDILGSGMAADDPIVTASLLLLQQSGDPEVP